MKSIKSIFTMVLALGLFTSVVMAADGRPEDLIVNLRPMKQEAKALVTIPNLETGSRVILTIWDEEGHTLHRESFEHQGGYAKMFDFTALADGKYSMDVKVGNSTYTKAFAIRNGAFEVAAETAMSAELSARPKISKTQNKVVLRIPELQGNAKISVYNAKGDLVFSEAIKGKMAYRSYNLSELPSGNYAYEIQNGTWSFADEIIVNR